MTRAFHQTIAEPSAWTPAQLMADRNWEIDLSRDQTDDLLQALQAVKSAQLPLTRIGREDFPLPRCAALIDTIRHQLKAGRGFALLHGFPVEGHDLTDIERMYWGLCAHLGIGLTQNGDGSLIHYVTEGRLRPSQGTRGVGNPGKVSLHVDLADCVSLLCVRQSEDSPPSRLASATALHNALLDRDPGLLQSLYDGFVWDRQNEHDARETPTTEYRVPMFSQKDGVVSCRYNRNWMRKAVQRSGGDFSPAESALFDLIDEIAEANCFEFEFAPGDIQFANNYTILHGRAPHAPAKSEDATRLLMRIWFNIDNLRPWADEGIIRYGVLRHGRLGWAARDLAEGIGDRVHPRRPADGAPVVA